jgi:hypothetical protein
MLSCSRVVTGDKGKKEMDDPDKIRRDFYFVEGKKDRDEKKITI